MKLYFIPVFLNKDSLSDYNNFEYDYAHYNILALDYINHRGLWIMFTINQEIFKMLYNTHEIQFSGSVDINNLNIYEDYAIEFPSRQGIVKILRFFDTDTKRKYTKL